MHLKYVSWLAGQRVLYKGEAKTIKTKGYVLPIGLRVKEQKNQKGADEDRFNPSEFPGFIPGKHVQELDNRFCRIDHVVDRDFDTFMSRVCANSSNQTSPPPASLL